MFTTTLLPLITKTAAEPVSDVRVVMVRCSLLPLRWMSFPTFHPVMQVSSMAHTQGGTDWTNAAGWNFKSRGYIQDSFVYGGLVTLCNFYSMLISGLFEPSAGKVQPSWPTSSSQSSCSPTSTRKVWTHWLSQIIQQLSTPVRHPLRQKLLQITG